MRFAVDLSSFGPGLRKALLAAANLDIEAVELDARGEISPAMSGTALREVRKILGDLNLRVSALKYRTRHGYDVPERLEARVEGTKAAMELAYALRAGVVINHVGTIPADAESPRWKLLVEVLSDLGAYAQRAGAMLSAETGGQSGRDLARLLDALPQGTLAVAFDPGGLLLQGFSPLEAAESLGRVVAAVRLTDATRSSGYEMGQYMPLGQGSVDLPEILAALERHDYRGHLTLRSQGSADPVREINQSLSYLRRL